MGKTSSPAGSYIAFVKDGAIAESLKFVGHTFNSNPAYHVGYNLIAHVHSKTKLVIRKIINDAAKDPVSINHIAKLKWYDGNRVFYNSYDYDLSNAKADPSGRNAFFNKVGVIQGSANVVQRPFGHTDYYFFNGRKDDELIIEPFDQHTPAIVGIGEIYQIDAVSSASDTVSRTKSEYDLFTKTINNSEGEAVDKDFYLRVKKTQRVVDGVLTETTNSYDVQRGLLKYTTTRNSMRNQLHSSGNSWIATGESRTRYLTYWWEIYDPQRTSLALHDVVQITDTYVSSPIVDTLSSVVTRWKTWENGKRAPDVTYEWLRKNKVNFSAWNYPSTPDGTQWKKVNEILKRDLLTGAILESRGASGLTNAAIYDETRIRVLAQAINARYNTIAYTSFEDKGKGNWSYNDSAIVISNNAITGKKVFQSTFHDISTSALDPGAYTVSFWGLDGMPEVMVENGSVLSTKNYSRTGGWVLYKLNVSITGSSGRIKITSNGAMLDELRVHPQTAKMTSYTYDPYGNVTSQTSSNHLITYYLYDDMNRLFLIKDHEGNIIKRYDYRYRDEEEHLSALLQYDAEREAGSPINFSVKHPVYHTDTAQYEWNFGDGTQVTGKGPEATHTYSAPGIYEVSVTINYPNAPGVRTADNHLKIVDRKPIRIPESLVVSAHISAGFNEVYICPEHSSYPETTFSATVINSNCGGFYYTWYYTWNGGAPVQFGTGAVVSHQFTTTGQYQVYCSITTSCGQAASSPLININVMTDAICNENDSN